MIYIAMISRTDEPMEGVVFDVQDHARRTGTRGYGAHGEMISSDLHGAEEPIRWLLGWQRQDRVVTSPCMEKKKDTLIRTLWQRLTYGGSAPCRWYDGFDRQDATRADWTISGACGSMLGPCLARVTGCRSPRGANVLPLGC
jgi:hypothetical protein